MREKVIDTVGFILVKNGKILVEERSMDKRTDPGKVCIPSGGVEENESNEEAVVREVDEEFGVKAKNPVFLDSFSYPYGDISFHISYFVVEDWVGEIESKEAKDVFWISLSKDNVDIEPDKNALDVFNKMKSE